LPDRGIAPRGPSRPPNQRGILRPGPWKPLRTQPGLPSEPGPRGPARSQAPKMPGSSLRPPQGLQPDSCFPSPRSPRNPPVRGAYRWFCPPPEGRAQDEWRAPAGRRAPDPGGGSRRHRGSRSL
jgi:hypothetical protein